MNFAKEMERNQESSKSNTLIQTENGALGYASTGSSLLNMHYNISSYRKKDEDVIWDDFVKALNEDARLAMRWLFFVRDIREGAGERRVFRVILTRLAKCYKTLSFTLNFNDILALTAEYGRWDDMWGLLETEVAATVLECVRKQLGEDIKAMKEEKSISLLGKWLPSINASSKVTRKYALRLANALYPSATPGCSVTKYRKQVSTLRKYLDVTERKLSQQRWSEIEYSNVSSQANIKYKKAFMTHDAERRKEYLDSVSKGTAKINASVSAPHEIVNAYMKNCYLVRSVDATLENLWKALPDKVDGEANTLVVADGSGSMCTAISSGLTALTVANALAIYFAERASGVYKDTYITFSETPRFVHLNADTLKKKLDIAMRHNEIANTNIEAVFDLILDTAVRTNAAQTDIPKNILILSDMEFDMAVDGDSDAALFENLRQRYEEKGYKLPRLVFWNLNSRTNAIPMKENENGVALLSGFSTNLMKMVMSDHLDPYANLLEMLNTERYTAVDKCITLNA